MTKAVVEKPVDAVLLIGPTGSGKTPLGEHIESRGLPGRRCVHFDFGHELRSIASLESAPSGFTADEHAFIRGVLENGLLLENEHFYIAGKIIDLFLEKRNFSTGDVMLLNGLPRHAGQARDLSAIARVGWVVSLECTAEDVFERISSNSGGDRSSRTDDGLGMIRKKLEIFRQRTAPLIELYKASGARIIGIEVGPATAADEIYHGLTPLMRHFQAR